MSYRILVTGSRKWDERDIVEGALRNEYERARAAGLILDDGTVDAVLIHGDASGLDRMAGEIWREATRSPIDVFPASAFKDPLARNLYMVNLGKPDICLAFALKWGSGTGHCARAARRAGIPTIDLGVSTE